jgi:hypothetical protein
MLDCFVTLTFLILVQSPFCIHELRWCKFIAIGEAEI